jgi:protein subunit release factor A
MDDQEKKLRDEYTELEAKLQDPDIFSSKQYPAMAKRFGELNRLIILFDEQQRLSKQLADEKGMSQGGSANWPNWPAKKPSAPQELAGRQRSDAVRSFAPQRFE